MNIDVTNISPRTRKYEVHRAIASVLHAPDYAQDSRLPLNFNFRIFQEPDGQSLRGVLTLPTADVGRQFLRDYAGGRPLRRLTLYALRLRFQQSGQPTNSQIRDLQHSPYLDPEVLERSRRRIAMSRSHDVPVSLVQCGWECRDGAYSVETEIICEGGSHLAYWPHRGEFRVTLRSGSGRKESSIVIRGAQIIWASSELDGPSAVLFFSLYYPPAYQRTPSNPHTAQTRLSALNNKHRQYVQYVSSTLRLVCYGPEALGKLQWLCDTAELSHRRYLHYVVYRELFSLPSQQLFATLLRTSPFEIAFQLEALVHRSLLDLTECARIFPAIEHMQLHHGVSYTASFLQYFSNELTLRPTSDIQALLARSRNDFVSTPSSSQTHKPDIFQCYHATVTPTRVTLDGPYPEQGNRVIRRYAAYSSHFMRVSFTEEDRLHYRLDKEVDGRTFIHRRVGGILTSGLWIAGRHFKFLAYSLSGLKSHTVWLINEFTDLHEDGSSTFVGRDAIIRSLGTFDNLEHDPELLYCPARYAARISQAFTATDAAITMDPEEVFEDEDIYDITGRRSFTDGVGTISLELAEAMWTKLRAGRQRRRGAESRPCPRAFQIRFGGSKGMLSVDYMLQGRAICVRPSMTKFESLDTQIEVASVIDKPGIFRLNRPLIMLLEGLHAAGGYQFMKKLQDDAIRDTKKAAESLDGAAHLLEAHGLGTSFRLTSILLGIHRLGFNTSDDPFIRQMLSFAVHHVLRDLKYHARIPVPGGWTLVGVADVHGYLEANEVFACVLPSNTAEPIYLEGPMLIARSPVIHPGDVQVVHALGRPPPDSPFAKEQLTNTVVFSIKGPRPLASCLAGGDLDGDCFVCTTISEMLPRQTYQAAEYNPAKRKTLKRPAQRQDIIDFVAEYIYSDNIGVVATNWLMIADVSPHGILDPSCLELAKLHSDACDYPKTGLPVPLHLIPLFKDTGTEERTGPRPRPDWSAPETHTKGSGLFYESQRWLGKLYRDVELPAFPLRDNPPPNRRNATRREDKISVNDVLRHLQLQRTAMNRSPLDVAVDRIIQGFHLSRSTRMNDISEILDLFSVYTQNLRALCSSSSYTRTPLREAEITVGTIIAKTSQPRVRQEYISNMRERGTSLVDEVLDDMNKHGGERERTIDDHRNNLYRAWVARKISLIQPGNFGAASFGLIALGEIFDHKKRIEDAQANSLGAQRADRPRPIIPRTLGSRRL